jgi:Spy/CpxP family protein refolding chaperone
MLGRLLLIAIISAGLAMPAVGQNPERQQRKELKQQKKGNKDQALKFQKRLGLTDEQTSQVRALLAERERKDAKGARRDFQTRLRAILTPEQLEKLGEGRGKKNK